MKENVIAAGVPRPVLDAHAVFPATRGGCSGIRVVERRGHGKPHAASTWFGTAGWRSAPERDCDRRPVVRVDWRPVPPSRPAPGRTIRDSRDRAFRSEEHTPELQSLMRLSYAVFCLTKKNTQNS